MPVACAATAANVNDALAFERLFLAAFAVVARIRTVFADKGYDVEPHRDLCRAFGAKPRIHTLGARPPPPRWVRFPPTSVGQGWVRFVRFQEVGRDQQMTEKGA